MRSLRFIALAATSAIALGLSAASAARAEVYFTANGTADANISLTEIDGTFFFGFYHVQLHGGCATCLDVTANGKSLGSFNLQVGSDPFFWLMNPSDGSTQSLIGGSEHFDGYGQVRIDQLFNGTSLIGGGNNFKGFSVFGTPGVRGATLELDIDQFATSDLISLPSKPLYLDITGTTVQPMAVKNLTPGQPVEVDTFAPWTLDFTMTLTDTPFTPGTGSGSGGVPEPLTWTMLLAGFGGLGAQLRRRRSALSGA